MSSPGFSLKGIDLKSPSEPDISKLQKFKSGNFINNYDTLS